MIPFLDWELVRLRFYVSIANHSEVLLFDVLVQQLTVHMFAVLAGEEVLLSKQSLVVWSIQPAKKAAAQGGIRTT